MKNQVKLTDQEIQNIFNSKGLHISIINEKGDPNNGMTFTMNSEDSVFYFRSFANAYDYFLEMNWI